MATLDYALLAEYARIDPAGLVTIVGGSFDRVQATSASGGRQTYVVMRVLLDESEETASFEVSVEPPNNAYALRLAGTAARNPAAAPVDGRVGVTVTIRPHGPDRCGRTVRSEGEFGGSTSPGPAVRGRHSRT